MTTGQSEVELRLVVDIEPSAVATGRPAGESQIGVGRLAEEDDLAPVVQVATEPRCVGVDDRQPPALQVLQHRGLFGRDGLD